MKKSIFTIFISFVLLALVFPAVSLAEEASGIKNIPIYRVCNNQSLEHLYTTDHGEVESLVNNHGWVDEGIGWYAPREGTPVYRLNNPALGNHLYTTDGNEIQVLTSSQGWVSDNNGQPLFYSGGSIPIYRLYNAGLRGLHLLTTDQNEYNVLPASGWAQEGTPIYATEASSSQNYNQGSSTIENTPSKYAIESDVTLNGSGSGYHAKIIACTADSAVSFGMQYDKHAAAPYTDMTAFLIENVSNNNAGGQNYVRTGAAQTGKPFHLMLTVQDDGTCNMYVNGSQVGSVNNPSLAGKAVYLRVEGSARLNGDQVNADFTNIKLKGSGTYDPNKTWGTHNFDTNPGIHSNDNYSSSKSVNISGTVTGLGANEDWDNAYGRVSGILQFVE